MDYIIVMPAFNEEGFIADTLRSIVAQSWQPKRLIVVNDGSTDSTPDIIASFAQEHDWIQLVNREIGHAHHAPGAKIVETFYYGFEQIEEDYEVIVKLDADLDLPPDYFERTMQLFAEDPKIGMAGGLLLLERNGKWIYENYADKDHIRGAHKAYRKACFEDMGGIKRSIGWDSVDEMLARFHGWKVRTIKDLYVKHFRATGKETGAVRVKIKLGYAFYRMRYGFWIMLISAVKAGFLNRPYILTGLAVIYGWFQSLFRRDTFIVSREEGKYIRQYRWSRMKEKLTGRTQST